MDSASNSKLLTSGLASGLLSAQQLDYSLRVARHRLSQQFSTATEQADPDVPDRLLADILVEQKVITPYQADQLLAGRTKFSLGSYVITDWIGQGGMGQVFKAVHHVMGRVCAVKVLPLTRATLEARMNFVQEIRMQAALDCPYLVRAYDAGQDGNVHYLVTEYVPGMDLRRLVRSQGPLPVAQAARILMQAALGLDYAHRQGLVHRDVKPGNILVTPEGEAKVSDVGLAGFAKDLMNDPRAGKIIGTTDYLSPEQIRTPLEIEPASDIYSLGCTLYYAICGKVPFPGGDTKSKLRRHLEENPMHPRRFTPDLPEDFVDIIADMMEKDVRKRIASAAQVAVRLEPWASEQAELNTAGLSRSPWLAPPPPSDEEHYGAAAHETESTPELHDSTGNHRLEHTDAGGRSGSVSGDSGFEMSGAQPIPVDSFTLEAQGVFANSSPSILPPTPPATASPAGPNTAMIVALTVAILLPPALMFGAIVGFILARS